MIKRPIRNLHTDKSVPPRIFDVVVDGDSVNLEVKNDKKKIVSIPWSDVVFQVEAARSEEKTE